MQHTVKILPLDLTNEADMTVLTESLAEEKAGCAHAHQLRRIRHDGRFYGGSDQRTDRRSRFKLSGASGSNLWVSALYAGQEPDHSAGEQCGILPQPGFSVYAATKSFVLSFSKALRAELKERQIYVTAVCPGPVKTEFFRSGGALCIHACDETVYDGGGRSGGQGCAARQQQNRPMSVCSLPIQAFWAMTRLLPQDPVICLVQKMREKRK